MSSEPSCKCVYIGQVCGTCVSVSSIQAGPLDLLTDDFYSKRTEMIETRLKWIKSAANKVVTYPPYVMYSVGVSCFTRSWPQQLRGVGRRTMAEYAMGQTGISCLALRMPRYTLSQYTQLTLSP